MVGRLDRQVGDGDDEGGGRLIILFRVSQTGINTDRTFFYTKENRQFNGITPKTTI